MRPHHLPARLPIVLKMQCLPLGLKYAVATQDWRFPDYVNGVELFVDGGLTQVA